MSSRRSPAKNVQGCVLCTLIQSGDSLWQVLEHLRVDKISYPKVEVTWDESCPHTSAVVIHLPHLTLYFPPSSTQVLTRMNITDLRGVLVRYDTHVLSAPGRPGQTLTRGIVGRILGPTYDAGTQGGLVYPGVTFQMRPQEASAHQQTQNSGPGASGRDDVVDRIVVLPREGEAAVQVRGIRHCQIIPGKGVNVTIGLSDPIEVVIGETTYQDILLDLGPPIRRFWKEDDRMEKMWAHPGVDARGGPDRDPAVEPGNDSQDFLNYFQYGLDFLCSSDGVVKKVIAYSNIPGTPLFQRYAKCPWKIATPGGDLDHTSPLSAFATAFPSSSASRLEHGAGPRRWPMAQPAATSAATHLDIPQPARPKSGKNSSAKDGKKRTGSDTSSRSASSAVADASGRDGEASRGSQPAGPEGGMLLDRTGEGGLEGVVGDMISRLVGFGGMVVEEDIASGGVSSVLIFREDES